jgi:hypothetical protein
LLLESLETRALLSVTANSLAWKNLDFIANGNVSGYVTGGKLGSYRANLFGPINVLSDPLQPMVYLSDYPNNPNFTTGSGQAFVDGTITATVPGYGQVKQVKIESQGTPNAVGDANGTVSIAAPGMKNAQGQDMVLTGAFNTKDFKVSASSTISLTVGGEQSTGVATWNGVVQPTSTAPYTVDIKNPTASWDAPGWNSWANATVNFDVAVTGPAQKSPARTTPVAIVTMQWFSASGKKLTKLSDQVPLMWNQAGGNYTISQLPTPPAAATHLQLIATKGRTVLDTLLVALPAKPVLSIKGVTVVPPESGTVDAVFQVKLTGVALAPVTVKYTTANGTARQGDDYTRANGTLTFPVGVTEQTIVVKVKRDKTVNNETFSVKLSSPAYAVLSPEPGQGVCLIQDVPPLSPAAVDQLLATG